MGITYKILKGIYDAIILLIWLATIPTKKQYGKLG